MSFCVAIDGPAASGKGTISRAVAAHCGLYHLDTGLLYRAVGARYLRGEDPEGAARDLGVTDLDEPDSLRGPDIAQAASRVAAIPEVRAALVDFQRAIATRSGGAVLDGRDIGTVICPDAAEKLFVVASDAVRARRRHDELRARGLDTELQSVLEDIRARDARDAEREAAPMKPAEDAILLDTTDLSIEDAVRQAIEHIAKALPET